jgi:hypothetical protein
MKAISAGIVVEVRQMFVTLLAGKIAPYVYQRLMQSVIRDEWRLLTTAPKFGRYIDHGLLTFDHLGDEQNAIALCPSCHRAFDNTNDPGLIFIPTNLSYFIEFEEKDFDNRMDIARRLKHIPPRMVPTPQMYLEHQKGQGILPDNATGGQYWRYTLRDYFPVNADKSFIPGLGPFKDPGIWHGAPMAALRRAFQVLGDPVVEGIPEEQLNALWELRHLYSRRVNMPAVLASAADDGAAVAITEGVDHVHYAASIPQRVGNAVQGEGSPSASNTDVRAFTQGPTQSARQTYKIAVAPIVPTTLKTPPPNLINSNTLLKYGAGATTEINILRYLTMIKRHSLPCSVS